MNKRGGESIILQSIITWVIIGTILIFLVIFVIQNSSGNLIKKQLFAKQLCLVVTGSKPGTTIEIMFSGASIDKNEEGLLIKDNQQDRGYFYPCYTKNIEIVKHNTKTIIEIK